MKHKILAFVICLALMLAISLTVSADMGHKPSVYVILEICSGHGAEQ